MQKMIKGVALAAAVMTMSGCIIVNKNDGGSSITGPAAIEEAYIMNYEVGENTVEASDTINCLFGFITWGSSATHIADCCGANKDVAMNPLAMIPCAADAAKNGAYANACDKGGCDAIIGSKYKVTTEDYFVFKKITAEVKGYPAKCKGVEKLPPPCPCKK